MDDFSLEFGNFLMAHTTDGRLTVGDDLPEPANPPADAILHGDPEGGNILFEVPGETVCPVVFIHEEVFTVDAMGKPTGSTIKLKCVPAVQKRGAASFGDDEMDESNSMAWRTTLDEHGELATNYSADFRHDPDDENDFPAFMESFGGLFSAEVLREMGEHVKDGEHYRDPFYAFHKKGEPIDDPKGNVELVMPSDDEVERIVNPNVAPTLEQLGKAMQVFEANAEAVKHLAYIEWRHQPDVTVRALDLKRGGFVKSDGRFLSLAAAAGIAVAVKPEKGTQLHMAELVCENFPGDASAALFAERIEAVAALPR